jgi:hypothetical protein
MKKILMIMAVCLMCIGALAQGKKDKVAEVPMYEVKSGIVTMEMEMMGRKIVQEIYFDDYGAKQAMMMDFRGKKVRAVEKDGEYIVIDEESMTGTRMPAMGMGGNEKINFLDKSEKNIKKNKIKELGTEVIAGKECTKYSVAIFMMGQVVKQHVWVYKGITLKTAISTDYGEMGMAATSLVEDVEIPAETFEVPEGIEIQTMSHGGHMGGGQMGDGPEF